MSEDKWKSGSWNVRRREREMIERSKVVKKQRRERERGILDLLNEAL